MARAVWTRSSSPLAALAVGLLLLASLAATAADTDVPETVRALRASQERSAEELLAQATALRDRSTDPVERAWAALAAAEFQNDLEDTDAALDLLARLRQEARVLGLDALQFEILARQSTILVNRGKSAETDAVLAEMAALADRSGDRRWRAQLAYDRGVLARKLGDFAAARARFEEALTIERDRGNAQGTARALNAIGMLDGRTGRFSDAVLAHNEALSLARESGARAETARSLRLLGVLYRNLDDEELGSRYLREALEHVETRNRREAIVLHGELASSYTRQGDLAAAERHAAESVRLAEISGSAPNRVNAYTRMAELRLAEERPAQAAAWSERAMALHPEVAVRDQLLLRLTAIRVAAARGPAGAALREATAARDAARRIGDRILERAALDLLAEQQLAAGRAADAFATRKAHQALDKELAMDIAARRIAVLESSLDRARADAERALLQRDHEIQRLTLNRQRLVAVALAAGLVALGAVALLLGWRVRETRRRHDRLAASRDELERLHRALLDSSAELERLAHSDALTGLLNRRALALELQLRLQRAQVRGQPLGVVLMDVDHFKQINDRHGHQAGDAVLIEVARRLRASLPAGAAIGRWGGEEFIAVIDDCGLETASAIAESVRRALADRPTLHQGHAIPITASFGIACATVGATTALDPLLGAADQALYRAKRGGRNRVEAAV